MLEDSDEKKAAPSVVVGHRHKKSPAEAELFL
jgi:hypothetical protein